MQKHFVDFYSPGTFVCETSRCEIESWDTQSAMDMARGVSERYGATPFGFRFVTMARTDEELNSKEVKRSGMYHLGGTKVTLSEVKHRNDPDDRILILNMEGNNIPAVIVNTNSWKSTQPFNHGDMLLDYTPDKATSGSDRGGAQGRC